MSYINAEFYRYTKIKGLKLFIFTMLIVIVLGNLYFWILNPIQDEPFNLKDLLNGFFTLSMMGIYLVFPLIITAYSIKSRYINQQISMSNIKSIKVYLIDCINTLIMATVLFGIWTIFILLISSIFFGIDTVSVIDFLTINFSLFVAVCVSSIQSISLQKIFKNKIIATGIFIFSNYVLAIIVLQLRFFSNILEFFTYMFPMSLVAYFYKNTISFSLFFIISLIVLSITISITVFFIKMNEKK